MDEYLESLVNAAKERSKETDFADYLHAQVYDRIRVGRSMDCDEYRALCRLAGRA